MAVSPLEQILVADDLPAQLRDNAKHCLGLSYMGLGNCYDAARMFRSEEQDMDDLSIADALSFEADLGETRALIDGGSSRMPRFMTETDGRVAEA